MSAQPATDSVQDFQCEFCQRLFRRESTLLAHLCEPKRRFRERDETGVRLGLEAYRRFYEITQGSAQRRDWRDFSTSSYYRAFVKFGRYCQEIRAVNFSALVDSLIRENVPLDHWCRDSVYERYLLQHVRREAMVDALARAMSAAQDWHERTRNPASDYLRFGNANVICHDITRARVTAWTIYNCDSGREFLAQLTQDHVAMIWPWIDSDQWQRRFQDFPADQALAQEVLRQAGW